MTQTRITKSPAALPIRPDWQRARFAAIVTRKAAAFAGGFVIV